MAAKTYVPQLLFFLNLIAKYAKRWQNKLETTLTSQQYACLVAVISAVDLCLQAIPPPAPNP